ncbi:MAG: response regulator transcription factor [Proteobacteria bacterium]|nr:response regulator transcription factor [Pseudomonadota bacterium]
MTRQPKASILVVEDDPAILGGLLDVLVFNGYQAKGTDDGGKGLTAALEEKFDLIILDVMLPVMDGFTICKKVREEKPDQAIIMLTAKGAEDDVITGFRAGADDYIAKPFSLKELMVRLEAILRRAGKAIGDEEVIMDGICFDGKMLVASFNGKSLDLTRREMDIIVYLNQKKGRIVTKKELLTHVWHYKDADIETRTVDIHMLKLKKKITTLKPDSTLIQTKRGEGYKLL